MRRLGYANGTLHPVVEEDICRLCMYTSLWLLLQSVSSKQKLGTRPVRPIHIVMKQHNLGSRVMKCGDSSLARENDPLIKKSLLGSNPWISRFLLRRLGVRLPAACHPAKSRDPRPLRRGKERWMALRSAAKSLAVYSC